MKAFILNEADFERLILMLSKDPKHGQSGGSSQAQVRDKEQDRAYEEAHSFYNYNVRKWIEEVKK